jgi:hypothetical protein
MKRALIFIMLSAGCGGGAQVVVPVATLSCPRHVEKNETFTIDGSASANFSTALLTVEPGGHSFDTPSTEIAFAEDGIVTATLVVDTNAATATCRIAVGNVAVPGEEAPAGPNLSGTFAMIADDLPELTDSVVLNPERQCPSAPAINLVHLEQQGTQVTMTSRTCVMKMPTVQVWWIDPIQRYTVPDAVIDLLPDFDPVQVDISTGTFNVAGTDRKTIGLAETFDPDADLPDDENDPAVIDADNDQRRGVTIEGTSGEQNMVYVRALGALAGTIVDDNRIEGEYVADQDASLLGAFSWLDPQASPLTSTFVMQRIDDFSVNGAPITCDEVRAHADELFAQYTPPTPPGDCPAFE